MSDNASSDQKMVKSSHINKWKTLQTKKRRATGSPLSPLLSNIMLNEMDKELGKQGHRYVRYADDFSVYTKSNYAARKVGNSIYLFLINK